MFAYEGEILTLRPVGFALERAAIEAYLAGLPGAYQHAPDAPWTLVAPASDLPRLRALPLASDSRPGDPRYAVVAFRDDGIWVHPGSVPNTWARAQNVVIWLLGLGPWQVTGSIPGQERELGIVRSPSELFDFLYSDPDIPRFDPAHPTESPPRVGQLTTFRRYLGDGDPNKYFHMVVRVHEFGAFTCDITSEVDDLHWQGQLAPDFSTHWKGLVARLDFDQSSPGREVSFKDRVGVIVQRAGEEEQIKILDAEDPPESFAALVRLMDGWMRDLMDEKVPAALVNVQARPQRGPQSIPSSDS